METKYYLLSTEYSIQERPTKKKGIVYDLYFSYLDRYALKKQKKLSGFPTHRAAKQAFTAFVSEKCECITDLYAFQQLAAKRREKELYKVEDKYLSLENGNFTVRVAVSKYLSAMAAENKESTIRDKRDIYAQWVLPELGDLRLKDLTKPVLLEWQDVLWAAVNPRTGKLYSHAYKSKIRAHLSSLLVWCADRYDAPNNLAKIKIPKNKTVKQDKAFWEREEFEQFISVVDDPLYRAFFNIAFYTGHRRGEILALTPDDIHLEGKKPYIRFSKSLTRKTIDKTAYKITETKTYRDDKVPVCKTLVAALKGYVFDQPFAFGGEKPISDNTLGRAFDRYIEAAGVKRITFHGLRHSFVSMCVHYGVSMPVVANLIGDTVQQVMETYAHLWETDPQNALNEIDRHAAAQQPDIVKSS